MFNIILGINTYYIITLIVVILLIIYYGISYLIYLKLLINYNNPPVDLVDHTEEFYKDAYSWFQEIPKEDIYIKSYDGLKLHGIYIPSYDKKTTNVALIIHGYQSKATDMIIIGKMYAQMGFQVILTDLRGHGESEGNFTSFGYYEKYDIKKWINLILRNYGADSKILIHGVSMGAAATIMATNLDIPKKNIKFLLLDSSFTKLKKTLRNPKRTRWLSIFYLGINLITYQKHKFILTKINPIKQMKKNAIPFLIIQGENDRVVPPNMANELLDISPAIKKNILFIEDSKHALGFKVDYDKCYNKVKDEIQDIFKIKKIYTTK